MNVRALGSREGQLRWGTRALLAAGALGVAASLASIRPLEWLACGLLVAGAVVVHLATQCRTCGRVRLVEALFGRDEGCPCGRLPPLP